MTGFGRAHKQALPQAASRGLTLAEVLVALTLLAVVLLPVMVGFSQALITTSKSSISVAATSIARDKIEELKVGGFALLADQPRQQRDLNPGDGFFELAVTIETIRPDDVARSGLKRAVVSVYRTGSAAPEATLVTYFTPVGI